MLFKKSTVGEVAIITVNTRNFSAEKALLLKTEVAMMTALAEWHFLIDMTPVKRIDFSSMGTLLNLLKSMGKTGSLALCGLCDTVLNRFLQTHLDTVFTIYSTRLSALQPATLGPYTLTDKKALVLCAGTGTRARPLSFNCPKPMLEIMGKPILHHCIDHLKSYGVRDICLNTSYMPDIIEDYFGNGRKIGIQTTYSSEGSVTGGKFNGKAVGTAASLRLIQDRFQYFDDDFIVMCGDALVDLDFNRMMRLHKRSGAIATIATLPVARSEVYKYGIVKAGPSGRIQSFQEKPALNQALSRQANTGIYIFNPDVLNFIPTNRNLDIGGELLPLLIAQDQHVQMYDVPFDWTDIGCIKDYFQANAKALRGEIKNLTTSARQIRPSVWVEDSATVSPRARIHGPTYIGRGAVLDSGASLSGTNIIGAGCLIGHKTYCRDSIILPETVLLPGAVVSGMCASPSWSVRHSFAIGEVTDYQALDFVVAANSPADLPVTIPALRA